MRIGCSNRRVPATHPRAQPRRIVAWRTQWPRHEPRKGIPPVQVVFAGFVEGGAQNGTPRLLRQARSVPGTYPGAACQIARSVPPPTARQCSRDSRRVPCRLASCRRGNDPCLRTTDTARTTRRQSASAQAAPPIPRASGDSMRPDLRCASARGRSAGGLKFFRGRAKGGRVALGGDAFMDPRRDLMEGPNADACAERYRRGEVTARNQLVQLRAAQSSASKNLGAIDELGMLGNCLACVHRAGTVG